MVNFQPKDLITATQQILIGWRAGGQLPSFCLWKLHPQCGGVARKVSDESPGAGTESGPRQATNYDAATLSGFVRVK